MFSRGKIEENSYGNICKNQIKSVSLHAIIDYLVEVEVKMNNMIVNYLKISRKKEVTKRPTIVPDIILVGFYKIGHAFLIFVLKFGSWSYAEISFFGNVSIQIPYKKRNKNS